MSQYRPVVMMMMMVVVVVMMLIMVWAGLVNAECHLPHNNDERMVLTRSSSDIMKRSHTGSGTPSSSSLSTLLWWGGRSSSSSLLLPILSTQQRTSHRLLVSVRGGGGGSTSMSTTTATKATATATTATTSVGGGGGGGGTATMLSEMINLVKSIVGAGVLSLPSGVAAFADAPSAIVPASLLILMVGMLSAYGFSIIGKVCSYANDPSYNNNNNNSNKNKSVRRAISYRTAWESSVGTSTAWLPAWSATAKTLCACLAYSMVLADTFTSILRLSPTTQRTPVLLTITLTCIAPLCWLRDLKSLAPFSLLGILGMMFTALSMLKRYCDGTYQVPDGALISDITNPQWIPAFGTRGANSVWSTQTLILVSMLSTAYMAHFSAPKFYLELRNNTLPRFYTVVATSFGIAATIMAFITSMGFATFGYHASGVILNNYAPTDVWMSISRVAVALSLVATYPLVFQGCRDGVFDILQIPTETRQQDKVLNVTTIALLTVLTVLAATLQDVGLVLAVAGATLGNLLIYVYPAIMYYGIVRKQQRKGETVGLTVAGISAVLGILMGAIGLKKALEK